MPSDIVYSSIVSWTDFVEGIQVLFWMESQKPSFPSPSPNIKSPGCWNRSGTRWSFNWSGCSAIHAIRINCIVQKQSFAAKKKQIQRFYVVFEFSKWSFNEFQTQFLQVSRGFLPGLWRLPTANPAAAWRRRLVALQHRALGAMRGSTRQKGSSYLVAGVQTCIRRIP